MKLYHGSKKEFKYIKRQQAKKGHTEVPQDELLNAIYFTPDYGRAVAMACAPKGENLFDDEKHTINFENPKLFDPNEDIYVYSVDFESIPENKIKLGENGLDYVVNEDEIIPSEIKKIKAREVLNFYSLLNWNENLKKENIIKHFLRMK
jgi:hypothetical protein